MAASHTEFDNFLIELQNISKSKLKSHWLALDFSLDYVILHQPRLCSKSDITPFLSTFEIIFFLSAENISKI